MSGMIVVHDLLVGCDNRMSCVSGWPLSLDCRASDLLVIHDNRPSCGLARVDNMSLYYRDILSWGRWQNEFRFAFDFASKRFAVKLRFVLLLRNGCKVEESFLASQRFSCLASPSLVAASLSCATYLSCLNNSRVWVQTDYVFAYVQNWFTVAFSVDYGLKCIIGLPLRSIERPKMRPISFCSRKHWLVT